MGCSTFMFQAWCPVAEARNIKLSFPAKKSTSHVHCSSKKYTNPLADFQVQQVIERQSNPNPNDGVLICRKGSQFDSVLLNEAYQRCQKICAAYAKTYYLGTLLMTEERKKAIWAIYAWGRRTDELVDGPNAHLTSSTMLDRWEERLQDIFNGSPYDMLDSALTDTIQRFPLDIKPFKDMIQGMRMDTSKHRYESFEELYNYCYYVAGTIGLMSVPIMGISPEYVASTDTIYHAALCLGIGNQLTNILRDVGEDALMGRIYLPQDELREFGVKDEDIFSRNVTDEWRELMKKQITRARGYFDQAEQGAAMLDKDSRWPVLRPASTTPKQGRNKQVIQMANAEEPLPNPYTILMRPGSNVFDHIRALQEAFNLHRQRDPHSIYADQLTRAHCLITTLYPEAPWLSMRERYRDFMYTRQPGEHAGRFAFVGAWNALVFEAKIYYWAEVLEIPPTLFPSCFHGVLGLPAPPAFGPALYDGLPPGEHIDVQLRGGGGED